MLVSAQDIYNSFLHDQKEVEVSGGNYEFADPEVFLVDMLNQAKREGDLKSEVMVRKAMIEYKENIKLLNK